MSGYYAGIRVRVRPTDGAIYRAPKPARKRRRCDGHMAEAHWIEVGDPYVTSSLPPNNGEIGNTGWWHSAFCLDCAPNVKGDEITRLAPTTDGGRDDG